MKKLPPAINFKKYKGLHLVILNNKIVGSGKTSKDAIKTASRKYPKKQNDFYLFLVPKTEVFVYVAI